MVQNRNWQKRVEDAEARRQESKQRKRKNEDKRLFKSWVQDLLRTLDEHADRLRLDRSTLVKEIHVWVDKLPSNSRMDLFADSEDESFKSSRRRLRANSLEVSQHEAAAATTIATTMTTPRGKNGRRRANSVTDNNNSKSKRKVHPRSRESFDEAETAAGLPDLPQFLCKSHFFTGECEEASRKKRTCRCFHYTRHFKTLHQVMNPKSYPANRQELLAAEAAADSAVEDVAVKSEVGAVEMVYYLGLDLKSSQEDEEEEALSDQIIRALSTKKVALASIVHMALGKTLVFDRNRQGVQLVCSDDVLMALVSDKKVVQRKLSIGSEGESDEERFQLLPGTVLEHILRFLPDHSVAAASSVCKSWNNEIGQNSPDLWRHLLERRNWPLPPDMTDAYDAKHAQMRFRDTFLRHYSVLRDVEGIQFGLNALDSSRKQSPTTMEMAYQDFSTIKHAPSEPTHCVGMHVWGPNQVLAAYDHDCSLRLFKTTLRRENGERGCKELVCQRVDPYRNTKKRRCTMVSVGLDEDCIGSLCLVTADTVDAVAYVLVIINRDEFLLGESSGVTENNSCSEAHLNVIDVQEAVLNYVLSSEGTDDCAVGLLHEVIGYIQDGGEIGAVEVLVSPAFTACGYGRFMLEVAVSLPPLHADDEDGQMQLLGRKLVLFSAGVGAIVWMGESVSLNSGALPRSESALLSSVKRPSLTGSLAACSIAVSPEQSPGSTILLDIEPSGEVFQTQCIGCPSRTEMQLDEEGWAPVERFRVMTLTSAHVAVADTFAFEGEGALSRHKVVLTFVPRFSLSEDSASSSLCLEGMEALQLSCVQDEYMVVVCRRRKRRSSHVEGDATGADAYRSEIVAVLVHIPTCREIGCRLWVSNPTQSDFSSLALTRNTQGTVGVGLSCRGVVVTGCDVRAIGESLDDLVPDSPLRSPKMKKKKRKNPKSSRKDVFARGKRMW